MMTTGQSTDRRGELFIDIETIPMGWQQFGMGEPPPPFAVEHVTASLANKSPPSNYGEDAAARWWAREFAAASDKASTWYRRGSVDPKRGCVLCVGYAVDSEPVEVLWYQTELGTLKALDDLMADRHPDRIIAWKGEMFDFPFLWERAVGYQLFDLARWFASPRYGSARSAGVPFGPARLTDPANLWSTTPESSGSLSGVLQYLGIDRHDQISGADVLQSMVDGRPELVREHVIADVAVLRDVWRRLAPAVGL